MLKVFMRLLGAHAGEAPSGGHRSTLQTAPALCQYQDTRQARSGGSRARQPADNLAPSLLLVKPWASFRTQLVSTSNTSH